MRNVGATISIQKGRTAGGFVYDKTAVIGQQRFPPVCLMFRVRHEVMMIAYLEQRGAPPRFHRSKSYSSLSFNNAFRCTGFLRSMFTVDR